VVKFNRLMIFSPGLENPQVAGCEAAP